MGSTRWFIDPIVSFSSSSAVLLLLFFILAKDKRPRFSPLPPTFPPTSRCLCLVSFEKRRKERDEPKEMFLREKRQTPPRSWFDYRLTESNSWIIFWQGPRVNFFPPFSFQEEKEERRKTESRFFPSLFGFRQTWIFDRSSARRRESEIRSVSRLIFLDGEMRGKRQDQGEESSSNRDEACSPPRYINFHRSRSLRAFFTITHPFYPRLPILYNSRDVPRNNNFSPFPRPSKTLISRNETSNFFRPLHLLPLLLPAKTADKMASRDVSFVSSLSPSLPPFAKSLYEFFPARSIYRYCRETAKQVPPPILSPSNDSLHR